MNTPTATTHQGNNLSVFLLGAILNILAVLDYNSLVDYSAKAVIGGMIWLAFKVIGEHLAVRIQKRKKSKVDEVAKVRAVKRRGIGVGRSRSIRIKRRQLKERTGNTGKGARS